MTPHQHLNHPRAEPRPERNVIGGIGYQDPFQWLESETEEVLAWQDAQHESTSAYLGTDPARARLHATVKRLYANAFWYWAPRRHGDRWFRQIVPHGGQGPVIEVAGRPAGPGRVLVDPGTVDDKDGRPVTLLFWTPSRDGRRLAYGLSDPTSVTRVRVIDVDSGEVLLDGLPHDGHYSVAWLPDGSGFHYVARAEPSAAAVYLLRLDGNRPQPEPQRLPPGVRPTRVHASPDGRYLLLDGAGPRPHAIKDLGAQQELVPFLRDVPGRFTGTIVEDRFLAVTDNRAPNGRLVAIPLATPTQLSTWTELVPAGPTVLCSIAVIGQRLVLGEFVDGATRLRVLRHDGTTEGEIPLPTAGMAWSGPGSGDSFVSPGDDECTFVFSSLTRAPGIYHCRLATRTVETITQPKAVIDDAVTHHRHVRSQDSTLIPYKVVARRDVDLTTPQPTIISGYGALNNAWLPSYLFTLPAAWVSLGGVYVHAHLRGGGEYGTEWWQAARLHSKHKTFEDLYAIAEDLIARGQTSPHRLGVFGVSAGAIPAAVAVTQRPELLRAAVLALAPLDLLRCRKDPTTMADIVGIDLGDPDHPGDAQVLFRYSPYHHIRDGTPYPAVLVDCGTHNRTCPAWHGRKMIARLQQATSSGRPCLLRVRNAGHNPEMTPRQMKDRETEHLTFLARELGL